MASPPGKRVRLRLVDKQAENDKPEIIRQMEMDSAAFEAELKAKPGRSILEEEAGLDQETLARLKADGLEYPSARRLGRRLTALDLPRTEAGYRKLMAVARVGGVGDVADLNDAQVIEALGDGSE
jgi:hypothetical protein